MERVLRNSLALLVGGLILPLGASKPQPSGLVRVYEVDKKVVDFPEQEDYSTPEAAYAVINRVLAKGDNAAWKRISVKELAEGFSADAKKSEVPPEKARKWLNAQLVEVRIFKGIHACVIAQFPTDSATPQYDIRYVDLEEGCWLNRGEDVRESVEAAREVFALSCGQYIERQPHLPVADPQAHLKPFVEFLKKKGEEPKAFVLKALARHPVTLIGEFHHRPLYWAFNSALVRDPKFPRLVGTIYLELPSHDQYLVDQFLAAEQLDPQPIIQTLQDIFEMGWPDQAMLEFFEAVWRANQAVTPEKRVRVVLVDMPRPWKEIQARGDWRKYETNRDQLMAENLLKDLRSHPQEKRHALFIVGVGHTPLNLFNADETTPRKSAGWYLRQALGPEKVFVIAQHSPVESNQGQVYGRVHLGLFDSAFNALNNQPTAFPLDSGPFGELPVDFSPEETLLGRYRDAYSAYLYMGPLEGELFSSVIPGFYTDTFIQEIDRRYRLMYGKGLVERGAVAKLDTGAVIASMKSSWGQPMGWVGHLGPVDAWHYGDNWEKEVRNQQHQYALEHPEVIREAAQALFDLIRAADYDNPNQLRWDTNYRCRYEVYKWEDTWSTWVCQTFKANSIKTVALGEVFAFEVDLPRIHRQYVQEKSPTVSYKVTLTDGKILEGFLPFEYEPLTQAWKGNMGLDWHLDGEPRQ